MRKEVVEGLGRIAKGVPVVLVRLLHAWGHAHAAQLAGIGEQVRAHPHLSELLHAPLFAALVLEPDLEQTELFLKRTKSYLK